MFNYHTIALISHASKVILKMLLARLEQYLNGEIPGVQAGFRKGRGTRNHMPTSTGSWKKWEFQKNIYFCFIDYVKAFDCVQFSSVHFSCSVMSDSLWPHESQHVRPPCPSPTPGVHSDSHPLSQWCHLTISSSVIPFSSCPQSLPASESFPMSQLFAWGGQSTGVSALASFLPKKSQGWSPSEWIGWISLQSKGLSRVFSTITVQKHKFCSTQPSLGPTLTSTHDYWTSIYRIAKIALE